MPEHLFFLVSSIDCLVFLLVSVVVVGDLRAGYLRW